MAGNNNLNRIVRQSLYQLKHEYGAQVEVYKLVDANTNRKTGEKTVSVDVSVVDKAVVLPAMALRKLHQSISYISASKPFVSSGGQGWDDSTVGFIFEGRDLPGQNWDIEDWIVYRGVRYDVSKIHPLEYDTGWFIFGKAVKGMVCEQCIVQNVWNNMILSDDATFELITTNVFVEASNQLMLSDDATGTADASILESINDPTSFSDDVSALWTIPNNFDNSLGLTLDQMEVSLGELAGEEIVPGQFHTSGLATSGNVLNGLSFDIADNYEVSLSKPAGVKLRLQTSDDNATWTNSNGDLISDTNASLFDGVDDWANFGSPALLDNIFGGIGATLMFNLTVIDAGSGTRYIFDKINGLFGWRIAIESINNGIVTLGFYYSFNPTSSSWFQWEVPEGIECHISIFFRKSPHNHVVRVNGVDARSTVVRSPTSTVHDDSANSFYWGSRTGSDLFSNVRINDVRIYDGQVSDEHIGRYFQTSQPPPNTIIAHWKCDGDLIDETANNLDVVSSSGVTFPGISHPLLGNALGVRYVPPLDGVDDHIVVADHADLDMGTDDWTISAWVKTTNNNNTRVVAKRENASGADGYALVVQSGTGLCTAHFGGLSSSTYVATGTTRVDDGRWHHLAAVFDRDGDMEVFVDGASEGSASIAAEDGYNVQNSWPLYLGCTQNSGVLERFVKGQLANCAIHRKALSPAEISEIVAKGHPDDSDPDIQAHWPLDGAIAGTVTDTVGGHDGTYNGTPPVEVVDGPLVSEYTDTIDISSLGYDTSAYWRIVFCSTNDGVTPYVDSVAITVQV